MGSVLEDLYNVGLITDENLNTVEKIFPNLIKIRTALSELEKNGFLDKNKMSTISSWNGPQELHLLNHQINQMIAHGIYLLHFDAEKGKVCLLLGLELKDDLK